MEVKTATCEKCGHEWILRVSDPLECPKCGHIRGSRVYEKREVKAWTEKMTPQASAKPKAPSP